MKKRILLLFTLLAISFIGINVKAMGDSFANAYPLNLNQEITINYKEDEFSKYFEFIAPETRYYEFQVLNPNNDTYITLYNSNNEDLFFNDMDEKTGECKAYGNLVAGKTYYLEVTNLMGDSYDFRIIAKEHYHKFKVNYAFMDFVSYECDCRLYRNADISAILSPSSYTYDGKVKTPNVVIKNTANIKLIKNNHYTVSYQSGRKDIGKYKVTIKFLDVYNNLDSITKTFNINPKNTSSLKLTSLSKGFKAKWKRQTIKTTGYQLQYSKSKKFSNSKSTLIKGNKTTTKTIKNLKSHKKYYVRIRTYKKIKGVKYYSTWSKTKTVIVR